MVEPTLTRIGNRWLPSIPLPFFGFRKKCCECGRKFWTREGYNAHYAYTHIYLAK